MLTQFDLGKAIVYCYSNCSSITRNSSFFFPHVQDGSSDPKVLWGFCVHVQGKDDIQMSSTGGPAVRGGAI